MYHHSRPSKSTKILIDNIAWIGRVWVISDFETVVNVTDIAKDYFVKSIIFLPVGAVLYAEHT
mgnify:CR=1 FL=1